MLAPRFFGPAALDDWLEHHGGARKAPPLDAVLVTHPRDESDLARLFPEAAGLDRATQRAMVSVMRPFFAEIVEGPRLRVGILILPFFGDQLVDPRTRPRARAMLRDGALSEAARAGARVVCLGGLTASVSRYGRALVDAAEVHRLSITSGHSMTAVSVHRAFQRGLDALRIRVRTARVGIVGVGSVGAAFARRLVRDPLRPREVVIAEASARLPRAAALAAELRAARIKVTLEASDRGLARESAVYRCQAIVSATSVPDIIDIDRVHPGTLLVDDSQPHCWSRERAWARVVEQHDILPCEAGLIDVAALGYRGHFPFGFADHGPDGSSTAWCCLTEGMLKALDPTLPETQGEPTADTVEAYECAFEAHGLDTAELQCGPHRLPVEQLRREPVAAK